MNSRHPSEAAVEFLLCATSNLPDPLIHHCRFLRRTRLARQVVQGGINYVLEVRSGSYMQHLAGVPARRCVLLVIDRDLIFQERCFPAIGQDGCPYQPQALRRVDEHCWVGIRISGCVRHQERLAPLTRSSWFAGAEHRDIIRGTFAGTVVPTHQQTAVRALDDPRGVVVLRVEREDELGLVPLSP